MGLGPTSDPAPEAVEAGSIYSETAAQYVEAIGSTISSTIDGPDECAALDDLALTCAGGLVADIGCGPGRVAAYLAARGIDVVGFDIAPGMVAAAKIAHPEIRFELGTLTALPIEDDSLAGAVCWYSIIHSPLESLRGAWVELRRVLQPGGQLLIAFQAGDGRSVARPAPAGATGTMVNYRHVPRQVTADLITAGFHIERLHRRAPRVEAPHETTPQAMVMASVDPTF